MRVVFNKENMAVYTRSLIHEMHVILAKIANELSLTKVIKTQKVIKLIHAEMQSGRLPLNYRYM